MNMSLSRKNHGIWNTGELFYRLLVTGEWRRKIWKIGVIKKFETRKYCIEKYICNRMNKSLANFNNIHFFKQIRISSIYNFSPPRWVQGWSRRFTCHHGVITLLITFQREKTKKEYSERFTCHHSIITWLMNHSEEKIECKCNNINYFC